ncbi:hypothetical protein [Solidesulfovibrio sp.]
METILLKILEVQNEILAELRLLRQAVSHGSPLAAAPSPAAQPDHAAPAPPPAPEPAPPPQHGGRLTSNELADIGGQFLNSGPISQAKVKPVDASALSGSILDDIKAKNKAKRSAFAEFEKFGRDR